MKEQLLAQSKKGRGSHLLDAVEGDQNPKAEECTVLGRSPSATSGSNLFVGEIWHMGCRLPTPGLWDFCLRDL